MTVHQQQKHTLLSGIREQVLQNEYLQNFTYCTRSFFHYSNQKTIFFLIKAERKYLPPSATRTYTAEHEIYQPK